MAPDRDCTAELAGRVADARARNTPLRIHGADTRGFLGRPVAGEPLDLGSHRGIVSYRPTELVVTARAGTPISELEDALAQQGQMLAFEPPRFGASTIGGAIATAMSGPRRPFAGAARDAVLGVRCLNGAGKMLRFGGEVMKNVAGYDVARLMCGAFGTLGVLLDVSLKVVPRPEYELTLERACDAADAPGLMNMLAGRALPLSGATHEGNLLRLRLSGPEGAVRVAAAAIGFDRCSENAAYWEALRDQGLPFFTAAPRLWRLSVPPATRPLPLEGSTYIDWGGAQRWLQTAAEPLAVRAAAAAAGGHATLWRGAREGEAVFAPLAPALLGLQRRIKNAFDPAGLFNPGRMYPEI